MLRGGSWNYENCNLRVAFRLDVNPTFQFYVIGFRCVASPGRSSFESMSGKSEGSLQIMRIKSRLCFGARSRTIPAGGLASERARIKDIAEPVTQQVNRQDRDNYR